MNDPAQMLRSKGDATFKKGDLAGAAQFYFDVVKLVPNSVEDRQKLRKIVRKMRFDGVKPSFKDRAKSKVLQGKIMAYEKGGKWADIVTTAEEFLLIDPSNTPSVILALGRALIKEGHDEVALWCFEDCVSLDRKQVHAWEHMGEIYFSKFRDFDKARSAFASILAFDNTHHAAHKWIKKIDTEETLSGVDEEEGHRGALKNTDESAALEQEHKIARTQSDHDKKIAVVEADIIEDETNPKLFEKLADAQRKAQYFKKAEVSYDKAIELDPSNNTLLSKKGDMKLDQYELKIQKLEKSGNQDEADKYTKARAKLHYKEFAWRVKSFPSDLRVRYEFGNALYGFGKFREALAEFQQASKDSSLAAQVSLKMADCFEKDGKNSMAIKALDRALEGKTTGSDIWKELTYRQARLIETDAREGFEEKSRDLYERIFEYDVNYRDVSERV